MLIVTDLEGEEVPSRLKQRLEGRRPITEMRLRVCLGNDLADGETVGVDTEEVVPPLSSSRSSSCSRFPTWSPVAPLVFSLMESDSLSSQQA